LLRRHQKVLAPRLRPNTYDELYSGNGDRRLFLRQYPIISIQSIRYRSVIALKFINAETATNQQGG
jgi:hypothetical protein